MPNLTRFLVSPPKTRLGRLLTTILFWNPMFALVLLLVFGNYDDFVRYYLISVTIGTVVASFCFAFDFVAETLLAKWCQARRIEMPVRVGRSRFFFILLPMPVGLYLAFTLVGFFTPEVGDWRDYRFGLFLGTLISSLFFLLQLRRDAIEATHAANRRLQQSENERLQAQIAALTAQMNPHLLFNALNTVAALVPVDPQKAEDIIVQLAELYRGVLRAGHHNQHSLREELAICAAYLAIEQARFGARLTTRIEIDPALSADALRVPVLCVQPLVENAVKHGIAPRAAGGSVVLRVETHGTDAFRIFVEDDGVGLQSGLSKPGTGTAVRNCRERLRLHYDGRAAFDLAARVSGGTCAQLTFPLGGQIR